MSALSSAPSVPVTGKRRLRAALRASRSSMRSRVAFNSMARRIASRSPSSRADRPGVSPAATPGDVEFGRIEIEDFHPVSAKEQLRLPTCPQAAKTADLSKTEQPLAVAIHGKAFAQARRQWPPFRFQRGPDVVRDLNTQRQTFPAAIFALKEPGPDLRSGPGGCERLGCGYAVRFASAEPSPLVMAACAAASRAIGTRYGEQDT